MNWRELLFSFQGRVARQHYWLMVLLTVPFVIAAAIINGGFAHDPAEAPGFWCCYRWCGPPLR